MLLIDFSKNRSDEKLLSFKSIFCLKFEGTLMRIIISLTNFRPTRKKISLQMHNVTYLVDTVNYWVHQQLCKPIKSIF